MPSLILTGHPCTGKTTFAHLLAARALRHSSNVISRVVHIRECTACPDQTKAECYSDSHAEKTTRAALKSEFDRVVRSGGGDGGGSTLVILDSLNYIKGHRYELYCISKAAGERHGVVWIMGDSSDGDCPRTGVSSASDNLAKKRNRERKELQTNHKSEAASVENEIDLDGYFEDDEIMNELVLRYEPPDEKNRWENPLYKVNVASVLPWGKDGTKVKVSSGRNPATLVSDKEDEEPGKLLSSQMKSMDVKDSFNQQSTPSVPLKPAKKSASGFKRRGKKSAQQGSPRLPQSTMASATPTKPNNVPSSMASRNLTLGASGDHGIGSEQKMEDVIDGILESFLMKTSPLKEGMSTFNHVSAESNVLNQMDNVTNRVNNEILKAQKIASLSPGVGGKIFIALKNSSTGGAVPRRAMDLSKPLYGTELRSFRKQFLKWIAGHPMPEGTGEEEMTEAYIAYIESHI